MSDDAPKPGPVAGSPQSRSAGGTELATRPGAAVRRLEKLRITVVDSPDEAACGRELDFAQDEIRIGSTPGLELTLTDRKVSREHLAIRARADGWLLVDDGSTNGTYVGDLRIARAVVSSEANVRVGQTLLKLEPLGEHVEQELSPQNCFGRMLGQSEAMREMFAVLERVARSDLTVLIEGETGTGKELAAEGLHQASDRRGAFVTLNCGAIPRELIESELMGHVQGAFTGAVKDRSGAFVSAHEGTLFLDEVGELPVDMQAKLLRVLEHREVKPVGSDQTVAVDVRVVAATNRNLAAESEAGEFRDDLYYRLAVVVVRIPPLRNRLDDLPLLVEHIHNELNRRRRAAGQPLYELLDDTALGMLQRYSFPGNVRELRNIVERWAVLGATTAPGRSAVGPTGSERSGDAEVAVESSLLALPYHEAKDAWIERFERAYVSEVLNVAGGNVSQAARDANVDRRHLQRLMARYDIKKT